jgi:hypothetical protein
LLKVFRIPVLEAARRRFCRQSCETSPVTPLPFTW